MHTTRTARGTARRLAAAFVAVLVTITALPSTAAAAPTRAGEVDAFAVGQPDRDPRPPRPEPDPPDAASRDVAPAGVDVPEPDPGPTGPERTPHGTPEPGSTGHHPAAPENPTPRPARPMPLPDPVHESPDPPFAAPDERAPAAGHAPDPLPPGPSAGGPDALGGADPTPQAGPHWDSETWTFSLCFTFSTPSASYWICLKITFGSSTSVPNDAVEPDPVLVAPVDPPRPPGPADLTAEGGEEEIKICWEETLPGGEVATKCREFTIEIETGTGPGTGGSGGSGS